ncbi:MAG: hypothetical protein ACI8ZB_002883 [Desulforhopalus sp.]|jgi:hypothetical protein
MRKPILPCLILCLFFAGCAGNQQKVPIYQRTTVDDSERRSGPAMLLYEQAEIDQDINENVIVIPPDKIKKESPATENQ